MRWRPGPPRHGFWRHSRVRRGTEARSGDSAQHPESAGPRTPPAASAEFPGPEDLRVLPRANEYWGDLRLRLRTDDGALSRDIREQVSRLSLLERGPALVEEMIRKTQVSDREEIQCASVRMDWTTLGWGWRHGRFNPPRAVSWIEKTWLGSAVYSAMCTASGKELPRFRVFALFSVEEGIARYRTALLYGLRAPDLLDHPKWKWTKINIGENREGSER